MQKTFRTIEKKNITLLIFLTHTTNKFFWFKHRLESNQTGNAFHSFSKLFQKTIIRRKQ